MAEQCKYQYYACLLDEIRDAYFVVQDGNFVRVGGKLVTDFGYDPRELVGKPFIQFVAPEERERVLDFYSKRLAGQQVAERYETAIFTPEGTRIPTEITAWLTQYQGKPAVTGIAIDIRKRKTQEAEVLQLQKDLKFYTGQVIRAQEEERRRLARELHDETIQELLLINHRLQDVAAGTYGRLSKGAQERLVEVRDLLNRTINEVRNFTQDLRPAILDDMGLIPALRWLTDRLRAGDGLHSELRVSGKEKRLAPETELVLFRIAQEALSNVRKHAHASVAMVTLEFRDQKTTMTVSDNGEGFEPALTTNQFARQGKLGLAGIRERLELLGGTHKVESAPGKGTLLRVEVPP